METCYKRVADRAQVLVFVFVIYKVINNSVEETEYIFQAAKYFQKIMVNILKGIDLHVLLSCIIQQIIQQKELLSIMLDTITQRHLYEIDSAFKVTLTCKQTAVLQRT